MLEPNESNQNRRRYKWPWFAAAMVVLGIVLAIVWMIFAVRNVEQERHPNPPAQNQ